MVDHYEPVTETKDYNLIIPDGTIFKIWVVEGESPILFYSTKSDLEKLNNTLKDTKVTLENLAEGPKQEIRLKDIPGIIGGEYIPQRA